MGEPIWILAKTVGALHRRLLAEHGGLSGVRDPGGLEAAPARPRQVFAYGDPQPDLATLATAYAGAFFRNHPFVDGNKRVALAVAIGFLRLNGWTTTASQLDAYVATLGLAAREITEEEYAAWIRSQRTEWPSPRR